MELTEKQLSRIYKKYRLSPRESQILKLILDGVDSNEEIAKRLKVTIGTAKIYIHNLYSKFGISSKLKIATTIYKEL